MQEYIKKYLQEKGVEFKDTGNEQLVLDSCIFCGDNKKFHHFYMGKENGLWDCKKCGLSGHFNKYRQAFGDSDIDLSKFEGVKTDKVKKKEYTPLNHKLPMTYASRLFSLDTKFLKYLTEERKLEESIIKKFRIGSTGKEISIPIYENGVLVNIRYRRDPANDKNEGVKYTGEKGCKTALFNGDKLKEPLKACFITEGEFDAMQLIQRGITNVVSVTLGASYFSEEWADKFKDIQTVYICFDTDEVGRSGAKKVAEKIGLGKCKMIQLPAKSGRKKTDITDYFVTDGFTKTDFLELVKNAKSISLLADDSVKHIAEFNEKIREILIDGEHLGELSGYAALDEVMGGLRRGRLIIVSGLTNCGKTSFALNIALNLSVRNLSTFFFSLEMPPIDIVKKVIMLKAKLSNQELKEVKDPSEVLKQVDKTLAEFKGAEGQPPLPMYLYSGSGNVKFEILAECARIVKEEYDCECIFVDHLHYFIQNYGNLTAETSKIVRQIKQLAMDLDIPIVLLTHLNRGGRAKSRKGLYIPALSDLRDSGSLEQDADQVIFVCRDSESAEKDDRQKAVIKLAKNRDGYAGRNISMTFDEEITTFVEAKKGVEFDVEEKKEKEALKSEVKIEELPF
jgi:replicative DNA helicase